jgi:FKBP-type peptidyl-prolyl cis-trans isomerase FkpA
MKLLVGVVLVAAFAVSGCGGSDGGGGSPTAPTLPAVPSANVPFSTVDVRVGTGAEATNGRLVAVNYALYHYSATAADNKGRLNQTGPFSFTVGSNQAIAGFSQATLGMRVGGLRRAIVPPNLAYGNNPPATSGIAPNETLVFEIELLAVQ